ncbi:tRNA (adenosine(37)-N6)-threonylcarbamoyltransferase complex dimerization subunit type 1 TsaB, partial [Paracidovorax avenae]
LGAGQAVPASGALPRYVRDKVAQTTAERAAAREAASVAGNPSSATGAGASPQP